MTESKYPYLSELALKIGRKRQQKKLAFELS